MLSSSCYLTRFANKGLHKEDGWFSRHRELLRVGVLSWTLGGQGNQVRWGSRCCGCWGHCKQHSPIRYIDIASHSVSRYSGAERVMVVTYVVCCCLHSRGYYKDDVELRTINSFRDTEFGGMVIRCGDESGDGLKSRFHFIRFFVDRSVLVSLYRSGVRKTM
jgi:hypothetical protein